jgi:hypothetical protein
MGRYFRAKQRPRTPLDGKALIVSNSGIFWVFSAFA